MLTCYFCCVCKAFCSTIAGILTTHAIMKSVGVGDAAATALSATITWVLKDGIGMIGRIMFAWWKGCVCSKYLYVFKTSMLIFL